MEQESLSPAVERTDSPYIIPAAVIVAVALIGGAWYVSSVWPDAAATRAVPQDIRASSKVAIPVVWGDIGVRLMEAGVIDEEKFLSLYASRGGIDADSRALLSQPDNGELIVTPENAPVVLNVLWALGLGQKSATLTEGPMMDPGYGGPENFASTGGWTLARGDAMNHYAAHEFFTLTPEQEALVKEVAGNIYRPCCNNSTHFPDCNHGMAMLGLLELMASQGATEAQMYSAALAVNTLWFPAQYANIYKVFQAEGIAVDSVPAKELLGANVASARGYQSILARMENRNAPQGGTSCGA